MSERNMFLSSCLKIRSANLEITKLESMELAFVQRANVEGSSDLSVKILWCEEVIPGSIRSYE